MTATHEVTNQPVLLVGHDVADDPALLERAVREGAGWALDELHRLGRLAGSGQAQEWGERADRCESELRTHDRYGHRVDEVDVHPAWHSADGRGGVGGTGRCSVGVVPTRALMWRGPRGSTPGTRWRLGTPARCR